MRYLQVYLKLERVYEGSVHPQKRIDARNVIETVLTRLVQVWMEDRGEVLAVLGFWVSCS